MRIPGTLLTIWFVSPWPMKPAPTMPTRIGLPCASPAFRAGRVELAHLIARLGPILEDFITVREPFGDVQRAVVVGRELDRDVLEVRRALGTKVHDDVEDRPARRPHELRLGRRRQFEM